MAILNEIINLTGIPAPEVAGLIKKQLDNFIFATIQLIT